MVRLAAEDLGVNVLEFNCYDFVGATEGKTTAALVEAFKSAKRSASNSKKIKSNKQVSVGSFWREK